jgi:glycosyltransferase involved in cell wall biosynthesis
MDDTLLRHASAPIPSAPRIVCVGRLHEDKGQLLLIEAVRQLRSEGLACELVLVGDGPLRAQIQARIAHLRLEEYIRLAGSVSSAELFRHMQAARAVVVPSFAENLPSVIMEAFALGRPVIATSIGGIPELVEPGVCGWLVPASSVEGLANAIREVLDTRIETLERMGREGARRVSDRFRSSSAAERLARLFQTGES